MKNPAGNTPKARKQAREQTSYGSLSPKLLARIGPVQEVYEERGGKKFRDYRPVYGESLEVRAIMTDGDLELASQYSTPFENSNPEQRFPTASGMLQTGDAADSLARMGLSVGNSFQGTLTGLIEGDNPVAAGAAEMLKAATGLIGGAGDAAIEEALAVKGRSAFTKVNSTMIYLGSQPVKISCTLFFRAWKNAEVEVERQLQRLQRWALPESLSETGFIENYVGPRGEKQTKTNHFLASMFPSKIPPMVFLRYGNNTYLPLVIESLSLPLVVERERRGHRLVASVQCQFSSRTAWDRHDIDATRITR